MKIWLIAVGLCFASLGVGAQETKPNAAPSATPKNGSVGHLNGEQEAKKSQNEAANSPTVSTCDNSTNCYVVQEQQTKNEREQQKQNSLDALTRRYMWAAIIGVVGALVGVFMLFCQTVLFRRSADAAKRSADAIINIERPWLMLERFEPKGKDFWKICRDNSLLEPIPPAEVTVHFRNYGRTPAWLIESAFKLVLSDLGESDFPFEYGESVILPDGEPIPPKREGIPVNVRLEPYPGTLSMNEIPRIADNRYFLYLYGFLKYKDAFFKNQGELRETYFCYRFRCSQKPNKQTSGLWAYSGQKGANKAT